MLRRSLAALIALALLAATAAAEEGPAPPATAPAGSLQDARRALAAGDSKRAKEILEALTGQEAANGPAWALLGAVRLAGGDPKGALAAYDRASEIPAVAPVAHYNAACIRSTSGEKEEAFDRLLKARRSGFDRFGLLQRDPDLDPLRGDARFEGLFPTPAENAALFREKPRVLRVLYGEDAGDAFGWIGRPTGDADGDGMGDFLLTAPFRPASGPAAHRGAGRVYLYSGRTGREVFRVDGAPGDSLGAFAAVVGDLDGDGRPDLLAGAPRWSGGAGSALVLSGRDGKRIRSVSAGVDGDRFGDTVAAAGDLDGDGVPDFLVGAPGPRGGKGEPGSAHAYSGKDGRRLWSLRGTEPGDGFGSALAADTAGASRLIAVGAEDAGKEGRGRVTVYRGNAKGADLLFRIEAAPSGRCFGKYFLSFGADLDGDGTAEVFASDFEDEARGPGAGAARVFSGKDGKVLRSWTGAAAGEGLGTGGGIVGDLDGDGTPDAVVAAWKCGDGAAGAGKATGHSGKDGSSLFAWTSIVPGETFGFDAAALGDLDGDGGIDFLVTAAYATVPGPKTGRAFVIAGPAPLR